MANRTLNTEKLKAALADLASESAARKAAYLLAHPVGLSVRTDAPTVTTPSGRVYRQGTLEPQGPPEPPPPPYPASGRGGVGVITITSVSVTPKGDGYVGTIKARSSVLGPVYVHGYRDDARLLLDGLWEAVERGRWHKDKFPR